MRIDSLEDLKVFVQVVESGGLTAAGRILRMSTPQVSRKLARLEAQFGVRLLARSTRRVALAEEHRAFYERCRRVLMEVEAAEAELGGAAVRGRVRAAVPSLLLACGLTEALPAFLQRHPELVLQLQVSDRPLDPLSEGLDLAVQVGPAERAACTVQRLQAPSVALAASPAYLQDHGQPAAPADLARHACLRFLGEGEQRTWRLRAPDGTLVEAPVGGRFECDDSRTLAEALYAGLGVGHRPLGLLERGQREGRLLPVLPGYRVDLPAFHLVAPRLRLRSPKVAAVAALLRRVAAGA